MKNIALITGAAGGFGKEFVKLFLQEPELEEIWAIGRRPEPLRELAVEFGASAQANGSPRIIPVSLDLSERSSYDKLAELLKTEVSRAETAGDNRALNIRYLINNAGYGKFGSYADQNLQQSLNMIDLNAGAVVAVGLVCLPYMQHGSRIINISSQSSFFPLPYLNIYASTKVFVNHYTRALNVELKERGITATAVCPGWMKTGFISRAETQSTTRITNFFAAHTPDVVAAKALRDAKRGRDFSTYSFYVKATHLLSRMVSAKFAMKMWLKQQKIKIKNF